MSRMQPSSSYGRELIAHQGYKVFKPPGPSGPLLPRPAGSAPCSSDRAITRENAALAAPRPLAAVVRCGSVPIGQNLFGLFHLGIVAGKAKSQLAGSAGDVNFDGSQPTALHP
jgi:hypothetical protein